MYIVMTIILPKPDQPLDLGLCCLRWGGGGAQGLEKECVWMSALWHAVIR